MIFHYGSLSTFSSSIFSIFATVHTTVVYRFPIFAIVHATIETILASYSHNFVVNPYNICMKVCLKWSRGLEVWKLQPQCFLFQQPSSSVSFFGNLTTVWLKEILRRSVGQQRLLLVEVMQGPRFSWTRI